MVLKKDLILYDFDTNIQNMDLVIRHHLVHNGTFTQESIKNVSFDDLLEHVVILVCTPEQLTKLIQNSKRHREHYPKS
jgi:hypothetical protein